MGFAKLTENYPWDAMAPYRERAARHPDGLIDLSIGTPVDDTPAVAQHALAAASNSPGYPLTAGSKLLRAAVVDWFERRRGVIGLGPDGVLPTVGSKELVGMLPSLLGLGPGDTVVYPAVAYPTYRVGALLAGARPWATDNVADWENDTSVKLVWLNSPGNPTGQVLGVAQLREAVLAARRLGAIVVGDECYAELDWTRTDGAAPSVLDPRVCGDDLTGVLAAYSLSKQSNMAGYRAAFVAGDPNVVGDLLRLRKHLGMIVPAPVQSAMVAALRDDAHVDAQRDTYRRRRTRLLAAVGGHGFEVSHSEGGLYLWVRRPVDGDCWQTIGWLADRGIVAGPGEFYGEAGRAHVRIALTASDEAIEQAARRLAAD